MKKCFVSYKDTDGFRHSVEVQAESLYEAVALAARSFSDHGCAPAPASELNVEVIAPPVTHTVTLKRVQDWANGGPKSPRDMMLKQRLKDLLAALPGR